MYVGTLWNRVGDLAAVPGVIHGTMDEVKVASEGPVSQGPHIV